MVVELISVGTELLLGNIVNTNAAYLSGACASLGLSCFHQSVVGDNEERLTGAITAALERSDILILTGGLGPTRDDITKECVAQVLGKDLVFHEPSYQRILEYFQTRGIEPTENNRKQAYIPQGAIVVDNHNGTAPGLILLEKNKHVLLLPGPPMELKPMFEEKMAPYLRKLQPGVIYSKVVKLCGIGESSAETKILDLIDAQSNPTIAPYAKTGEVHLRVTARAADEQEALKLMEPLLLELGRRFGDKIYTMEEQETLEKTIVDLLLEKELKLGLAESCTGGMLAARFTAVSGVSKTFKTGLVTYSNEAKMQLLGVSGAILEQYGAVSENTAAEMVQGVCRNYETEAAVSITGIAGPTGGTAKKPVGLVYIGCQVCGKMTVKEFHFAGSREKIRESAVTQALILLRQSILDYTPGQ